MTGSSGGRPCFSAVLASHLASSSCDASLPGYWAATSARSGGTAAAATSGLTAAAAGGCAGAAAAGGAGAGSAGGGAAAAALASSGLIALRNIMLLRRSFSLRFSCAWMAMNSPLLWRRASAASRGTAALASATARGSTAGAAGGCGGGAGRGGRGGRGGCCRRGLGDGGRGRGRRARDGGGEAAPAGELLRVVGLAEARELHHVAGVRRMDELVAAERHTDVVHIAGVVAEEDEIAGQQLAAAHRRGVRRVDLGVGHPRDLDPGLRVGPLHQAGAVETGLRGRAAPPVRRPHVLLGLLDRRERLRCRA